MKKRWICLAMTVALAAAMTSLTAFSADTTVDQNTSLPANANTTVQLSIAPTYSVTIPAKIELAPATVEGEIVYQGSGVISAGPARLRRDQYIEVTLQAGKNGFVMRTEQYAEMPYNVFADDSETAVQSDDMVARFSTSPDGRSVTLRYVAADPEFAGDYADTVTFTVKTVQYA